MLNALILAAAGIGAPPAPVDYVFFGPPVVVVGPPVRRWFVYDYTLGPPVSVVVRRTIVPSVRYYAPAPVRYYSPPAYVAPTFYPTVVYPSCGGG
jgi:hypothetical protein